MPARVCTHLEKSLSEAPETPPSGHATPCDQMRFWKPNIGS